MKCVIRLLGLALIIAALFPASVRAQAFVRLQPDITSGTLTSTVTTIAMTSKVVGAFGSVKVQTLDSYSGSWSVQCSLDGTTFDTDNVLALLSVNGTTTVYTVTDEIGVWDITNAAGCKSIRVAATAGFASTNTTIYISASQSGGGASSGTVVVASGTLDANVINVPAVTVANLGPSASASYAATECLAVTTASTNATACADATANLYDFYAINTTATAAYLRFYNLAAAPTCSSATGFIKSVPIPAYSAAGVFGGIVVPNVIPVNYTTGIGFCVTAGGTSTDNSNAVAGIYISLKYKK